MHQFGVWRIWSFVAMATSATALAQKLPMQVPFSPPPPAPQDLPYHGPLILNVDARDAARRILHVREEIPTQGGEELVLLYPMWMPGNHAPRGVLQNLAGLKISANGVPLEWRRDPANTAAFRVSVPPSARSVSVELKYLAPLTSKQGRIVFSREFLNLPWNAVLLYPAGHYARQIEVRPSITLPEGWSWSTALRGREQDSKIRFEPTSLAELIDSPLYSGPHMRRLPLDDKQGGVRLNVFAENPQALKATAAQIAAHREMIRQVDLLFGSRPFATYDFLLSLSDRFSAGGTEHQKSSENRSHPGYFAQWSKLPWTRTLLPHEYVHAWNGKFRRPELTYTADFNTPTRNELLWVYEGLTDYYGLVIATRSGLLTQDETRQMLALTAAFYRTQPGRQWRSLADTTNSSIISNRHPLPWPDYQRSLRDYYDEGTLLWLEVDTIIRKQSGERRSLDDFMRTFFAGVAGDRVISTYDRDDVIAALENVQPYDWREFFDSRVRGTGAAPLVALSNTGYKLGFEASPTEHLRLLESEEKVTDLWYSLGLKVEHDGTIQSVAWDSPAFDAGLTTGMRIIAVGDDVYEADSLRSAVEHAAGHTGEVLLLVGDGPRVHRAKVRYDGGLRYPVLARDPQTQNRLDAILAAR